MSVAGKIIQHSAFFYPTSNVYKRLLKKFRNKRVYKLYFYWNFYYVYDTKCWQNPQIVETLFDDEEKYQRL